MRAWVFRSMFNDSINYNIKLITDYSSISLIYAQHITEKPTTMANSNEKLNTFPRGDRNQHQYNYTRPSSSSSTIYHKIALYQTKPTNQSTCRSLLFPRRGYLIIQSMSKECVALNFLIHNNNFVNYYYNFHRHCIFTG